MILLLDSHLGFFLSEPALSEGCVTSVEEPGVQNRLK